MLIRPIRQKLCNEFVSTHHYLGTPGQFWYAFGLFEGENLTGVVQYGAAGKDTRPDLHGGVRVIQLNRLVVTAGTKYAAGRLVSHSLRLLPRPAYVVTYSDTLYGHVGYVFQATNWRYTGPVKQRHTNAWYVCGYPMHERSFANVGINPRGLGLTPVPTAIKHRYVYMVGSHAERRSMLQALYWPQLPYPKGNDELSVSSPNHLRGVAGNARSSQALLV